MSTELNFITLPEITPAQQTAIELMLQGIKQTDIAEQIDVAAETISRWKLDSNFVAALNGARLARWESTQAALDNLAEQAIDSLTELLQSDDSKVRIESLKLYFNIAKLGEPYGNLNVEKVQMDLERQHKAIDNNNWLLSPF